MDAAQTPDRNAATQPFDEEPSRRKSGHPRIALVRERSVSATTDLERILRSRLLVLAAIGTFATGLDLAFTILVIGYLTLLRYVEMAMFPTYFGMAIWLWRRRQFSILQLRLMETLFFALFLAYCIFESAKPRAMTQPNSDILPWFCCIIAYGVLMPNTARRCLIGVGTIAIVGSVTLITCWIIKDNAEVSIGKNIQNLISWFVIGIGMTVAGAHWLDRYRREALAARRLGQYVLKKQLGSGGMGEVFLAEHLLLRRPCAVKVIRQERAGNPQNLLRFEREVQTTATLTHPNTVQIYDYGRSDDGSFYYAMEYLPGLTLEELVKQHGRLPERRAVHLLRQICGALREAHGAGLVHRDLKPANVITCRRGGNYDVAKLLDFGLVLPQSSSEDGERLTQQGTLAGTPAYMSPEQAGGQDDVDARSDIYSFGALAYFLLTAQPPFAGRSGPKMLAAHIYEDPRPLSYHRPDVSEELDAIVLRCLSKDAAGRFQDAKALESALVECGLGESWSEKEAEQWWGANYPVLA
jgi:eukaryotic-like serine/threonine-protein kinase